MMLGTRFSSAPKAGRKLKKKVCQAFFYSIDEKWHPVTPAILHTSWLEKEKELIPARHQSLCAIEMQLPGCEV